MQRRALLAVSLVGLGVVGLVLWAGRLERPIEDARPADSAAVLVQERVRRFWELYRGATAARVAGEIEKAVALYHAAIELNRTHEDALYYLGNLQFGLDRFADAEWAWRRLAEVNPVSSRAHAQLGMLYACRAHPEGFDAAAARAEFRRALEINQEETGPLLRLGELALLAGDQGSARQQLSAVVRTNPRSAEAYFLLGYIAWADSQRREAAAWLQEATRAARPLEAVAAVPGEGDTRSGIPLERRASPCPSLVPDVAILAHLPEESTASVMDSLYRRVAGALADAAASLR